MSNPYAPPEDRPRPPEGERPVPPWPLPPGPPTPQQWHAPQPRPEPVPTDPEGAAHASRLARLFALLVVGSVLVSATRLPIRAAALVFGIAAMAVGVWALIAAGRAHVRGSLPVMLAMGLVVAFLWTLVVSAPFLYWNTELRHQRCLDGALTVSARNACESAYQQDMKDARDALQERARG